MFNIICFFMLLAFAATPALTLLQDGTTSSAIQTDQEITKTVTVHGFCPVAHSHVPEKEFTVTIGPDTIVISGHHAHYASSDSSIRPMSSFDWDIPGTSTGDIAPTTDTDSGWPSASGLIKTETVTETEPQPTTIYSFFPEGPEVSTTTTTVYETSFDYAGYSSTALAFITIPISSYDAEGSMVEFPYTTIYWNPPEETEDSQVEPTYNTVTIGSVIPSDNSEDIPVETPSPATSITSVLSGLTPTFLSTTTEWGWTWNVTSATTFSTAIIISASETPEDEPIEPTQFNTW